MADFAADHFFALILLIGAGMIAAFVAVAYLLLKLGQKLGGEKAAKAVGVVLVGLALFEMFDVIHTCSQPPVFKSEAAIFACDGPGGAIDYAFAYLFFPAAAAFVAFLTFRVTRRSRQPKANA